ncbi:MAG: hypothetical protein WDA00_07875 [Eubacteriales bacterium]
MKAEKLPLSVDRLVRALCADYERRARELLRGKLPPEQLAFFSELNDGIDRALTGCDVGVRQILREDIALGRGFTYSPQCCMCAGTYKKYKRQAKWAIARHFRLL